MKVFLVVLLVGALFVSCTVKYNSTKPPNVKEIKLEDGTRCAVIDNVRGNSIDCEWSK